MRPLISFYCFLLANRDFISFFSGIIISGYVVSISLNENNNAWHWIAVFTGLVIGLSNYLLIKISMDFNDNVRAFQNNEPTKKTNLIYLDVWSYINEDSDSNRLFFRLPKFWVPISFLLTSFLIIIGWYCLYIGNNLNQDLKVELIKTEKKEYFQKIDSIIMQNVILKNDKIEILSDSLCFYTNALQDRTNQIDSLKKRIILLTNRNAFNTKH